MLRWKNRLRVRWMSGGAVDERVRLETLGLLLAPADGA